MSFGALDIAEKRGVAKEGGVWYLESIGTVYQRVDDERPLGEGPNRRIARVKLGNEVRQHEGDEAVGEALWTMCVLLAPFAPHIAEELHELFGGDGSVYATGWPTADAELMAKDEIEIPIQVNGKVRGKAVVPASADKDAILAAARADSIVAGYLEKGKIVKEIVVPGRLVNFVVTT